MDDPTVRSALIAGVVAGLIVGGVLGYVVRAAQYEVRRARHRMNRNWRGFMFLLKIAGVLALTAGGAAFALYQVASG